VPDLALLETPGPSRATFTEFAPLLDRDGLSAQLSLGGGTQHSFGNEVSATLLWRNLSLSLGQFHFQSDGFRENNEIDHDILAAEGKVEVFPGFGLFGQYFHRRTDAGDRLLRFDLDEDFFPGFDGALERDTGRLGFALERPSGLTSATARKPMWRTPTGP
jgi:hypothetical protein